MNKTQKKISRAEFLNLGTTGILGHMILCYGGPSVRCLVASLTSTHQKPVARLLVVKTKIISRPC